MARKMKCTICGWIYEPSNGIPKKGILPGVPFERLPEDFRCPKCGAAKKWFRPSE